MVTRSFCLVLAASVAGCSPALVNTCAEGYVFDATGQHCVPLDGAVSPDAGGDAGRDGGQDAGLDAPRIDAHVPCGGSCGGGTPHCLLANETCVACLLDGDCTGGAATRCEPTTHACVACLGASDCASATASRCDTTSHACAACAVNADCAHLAGTGVCEAGTCVVCSVTDETACGANSCDPATHACTTTPRGSVTTCRACRADSECASAMERCVPMQFMGASHGSYCLRQGAVGCMRPYTVPTPARVTASGAAAAAYCGVDEDATTCEAVQALTSDTACTAPGDCGASGLADGRCETVNLVANRCTYSCGLSSQCPSGANCGAGGYCGSP